jgi:hypothetical protein
MDSRSNSARGNPARGWREMFRRERHKHDPLLVFNMSIFNVANGWGRTFNPLKVHENGIR